MIGHFHPVSCRKRASVRSAGRDRHLGVQGLHPVLYRILAVWKYFLQIARLLAAALVYAVILACVSAGVIVRFELLAVAERETARILVLELLVRKFKITVPHGDLAGQQIMAVQEGVDRAEKIVLLADIHKKRYLAEVGAIAMRLRRVREDQRMLVL